MALDNVDPNIPLQAGRALPAYGPDWQAVQNAQRTAISLQQAQQVQQAQNALRQVFSNKDNYTIDKNGITVKPDALAGLAQASPPAFMDLSNNLASINTKALQSQALQSNVIKDWVDRAHGVGDEADAEYRAAIAEGVDPKTAIQRGQAVYTKGSDSLKAAGMPPPLATQMSPTFDPVRIEQRKITQAQREAQEKAQTVPEYAVPMMAGGGATREVPIVRSQDGKGWVTADKNHTTVTDLSDMHKIGTKEETAGSGKIFTAQTTDGKPLNLQQSAGGVWIDTLNRQTIDPSQIKPGSLAPAKSGEEQTFSKPQMVEIPDLDNPGKTKQELAQQITKGPQQGQWVSADANRNPLPTPSKIEPASQGRQGAVQIQRLAGALNEASASLGNLVQLPIGATAGIFQGLQNETAHSLGGAIKGTLANTLTTQNAQDVAVTFTGLQRNLAAVEAQGSAYGLVGLSKQMQALMPLEGDSTMTVLRKYAEMRQILDRASETISTNPGVAESQNALFKKVTDEVDKAVPYTVADINNLERSTKKDWLGNLTVPDKTAQEFAQKILDRQKVQPKQNETKVESDQQKTEPTNASQHGSDASGTNDLPHPATPDEATKLAPGTHYIGPDGKVWVR